MSKINHGRPQIRLLDNLRRELDKAGDPEFTIQASGEPAFWQQIAERPAALSALANLLKSISDWVDDESSQFSILNPPEDVKLAYKTFASARVSHRYDNSYSGESWIRDGMLSENIDYRAISQFFETLFDNHKTRSC